MHCSMPRAGKLSIAALLLFIAGAAGAGELFRAVPPDAQVTRFTRFNIRYSLRDIVADGVQKVEFYITEDMGRTWRLYGEDPDRTSPMTVEVPGEGVYGFVCIVTDRFGNRERPPGDRTRPETVIVVDRTPPQAKWLAPLQNVLGRGRAIELKWEASDANFGAGPVKIQYAVDARSNHDRDAVWNSLQENLSASGSVNWTPPAETSARYNFRLIAEDRAGNLAVAYNPATITVDTHPPMIVGVSPLRSNKLKNDIVVEANDGSGGSGVKEISLYTSENAGGTWTLVKETTETRESVPVKRASGQPIAFEAPRSGIYALWPVVFDEAGNATPLPSIGVPGPYVLTIDTEPPAVTLSNSFLMGRAAILANESRSVEWTAYDPHLLPNSGIIHLSLDNGNTWQELRSHLPGSGFETINFPFGSQSEEAKIKVTVADEFGNVGEAVSETFKLSGAETVIDSVTPIGTPVGASTPTPGGFDDYFSGDTGAPPIIAPPPGAATTIAPSAPATPYPLPSTTTPSYSYPDPGFSPQQPMFPQGSGADFGGGLYDPYAPGAPSIPSVPSLPTLPNFSDGGISGESTASSLPKAMLGTPQTPPSQTPLIAPPSSPISAPPPPPTASVPPAFEWNPSPQTATPAPSAPSLPPPPPSGGLVPPPPPGGLATTTPPPSGGLTMPQLPTTTGPSAPPAMPPAAPSTPPADASPPSDWASGPGLMPPPLPGGDSQFAMPDLGNFDWTGDLAPPPLDGVASAPSTPAPSLPPPPVAAPPSVPSTPSAPVAAAPQTGMLRPPGASAPSTPPPPPPADAQARGPAEVPPMAPMDRPGIQAPPPLEAPASGRPANPRAMSDHLVNESRNYLKEGRADLALDSGTKALNADESNPKAYMVLSQVYAQDEPAELNNFARAATLAKEATNLGRDWETWWNCADVYYRWAHKRNRDIQALNRAGQRPPVDIVDERNQALSNAQIAITNSATLAQQVPATDRKTVAVTQGMIAYLRALTVPEPAGDASSQAAYKAAVTPVLQDAIPYFQAALRLETPSYKETFQLGIINFRLGNLEKDAGNMGQAIANFTEAIRYLEQATTVRDTPPEGPREAYYMLGYCYDLVSEQAGPNRARNRELALRYWRQTAEFYPPGTAYREYAEQRIDALSAELGQ